MTVARATDKEIKQVNDFLNELKSIGRYNLGEEVIKVIKEDTENFKVLSALDCSDAESLLLDICRYVNGIRHSCVMFNLFTLMDNCADLESSTLDFNPTLKRGLELVELEKQGKLKLMMQTK